MSEVILKTSQGATYQPPESEISDLKSTGIYTSATVVRGTYFFYKNKDYNKDGTDTSVLESVPFFWSALKSNFYWAY